LNNFLDRTILFLIRSQNATQERPAMSATQAQFHALPPATFNAMLCTTMDTLPHHPRATQDEIATRREAAYLVIEALRPRDPLESMLATRVVATHYHAMHNLSCATQRDLLSDVQLRLQARAVALSRLMDATLNNLMDRQTAAPRQVTGLTEAAGMPSARPAPEAARAEAPPAPEAAPEVAVAPAPVTPGPIASAPVTPALAPEASAQAAAAPTAEVTPAPAASATKPAQGEKFTLDPALAERLLAEAVARMGTSLDALLPLAA
jgi:hypothetical protein